ncbi:MAG: hypothetical protein GWN71_17875, partial [Gammaproteobacteria bacterium]|nr:hypothetical protein [Gemmatimonadota bacterium]NIU75373.1 hypothetical protein [Gammaproteobacteria bacterium]
EKTARDRGKLLSETENIALIRAGPLELVRVGKARLQEEAWWRYGRELTQRRSQYRAFAAAETAARIGILILAGVGLFWIGGDSAINRLRRWRRFGTDAWQGRATCSNCGAAIDRFAFRETKNLYVEAGEEDDRPEITLHKTCWHCGAGRDRGGHLIRGVAAEHTFRRLLAWHNFAGAKDDVVRSASGLIESAGSAEQFVLDTARDTTYVRDILWAANDVPGVALEIALNDASERFLLQLELAALEARWREEEELAAIIDGELTPVAGLERLREPRLDD